MELPIDNKDYKEQAYWDERFEHEDSYDWFIGYKTIKGLMDVTLGGKKNPETKILILGCGNSTMSAEMFNDGYSDITNIDYSSVVIDKMKEKYKSLDGVSWEVMDITEMKFEAESFDAVIEKGTLDSLLVTETDPWNLSDSGRATMDLILTQVSNILKKDGLFISITFAQPHFRKPVYAKTKYNWSIEYETFGETFHFFYYTMKKGQQLSEADEKLGIDYDNRKLYCKNTDMHFLTDSEDEDCLLKNIHLNKDNS